MFRLPPPYGGLLEKTYLDTWKMMGWQLFSFGCPFGSGRSALETIYWLCTDHLLWETSRSLFLGWRRVSWREDVGVLSQASCYFLGDSTVLRDSGKSDDYQLHLRPMLTCKTSNMSARVPLSFSDGMPTIFNLEEESNLFQLQHQSSGCSPYSRQSFYIVNQMPRSCRWGRI